MSEPEKENLKDSKSRHRIGEYIGSSAWRAVPIFALIGILISYQFKLTMNKDVWFWFFSSIAQTFAALVALVAIFLLSRLGSYDAIINKDIDMMRTLIQEFNDLIKNEVQSIDDFTTSSNLFLIIFIDKFIPKLTEMAKAESDIKQRKLRAQLIIAARNDIKYLEQKKKQAIIQMQILLEHTILIIILSIFLIPFGSVNTEDSLMLDLWNNFNLKWAIIFGIVGLCFASLHKVESMLNEILSKE